MAKRALWLVPLCVVLVAAGIFGSRAFDALTAPVVETETDTRNTQVIESITRTEQVALLSLGVQAIAEKTERTKIFGMEVPGSERAMFLQYNFTAKLGLDGGDVRIRQTGDDEYRISIPNFIFIGHDDVTFRLVAQENGVLSWATPEIDTVEMTNSVLNDDAEQQYVESNDEILRDQARAFYTGIISAIDPGIELDFDFGSRQ